jgi:PIN domain nuclease of toxin-antitoxin system
LDTHAWAWSLTNDPRLSKKAVQAIEAAESVAVSVISLYEIGQKVRLGKWPEMAPHALGLIDVAERQGAWLLPISSGVSLVASMMEWSHRDPFDRIIAAVATAQGFALISADTIFDELAPTPSWPGRVW